MNDQEKSVMLAKAMGWETQHRPTGLVLFRPTPKHGWYDDFYTVNPDTGDPRYMALAWKCLNWGCTLHDKYKTEYAVFKWLWPMNGWFSLLQAAPADAQRLWLDKILKLAIEAGLVEVQDVE